MRRPASVVASIALLIGFLGALPQATAAPAGPDAGVQQQQAELPEWPEVNSARLVTVQETGPPSERLNLIVMCDGYQFEEMDKCAADVDRNQAVQWSVEPWRTYRHYINVYRLEIVSGESGVRCDPDEEGGPDPFKITPLRLVFSNGCVDPLARGTVYNRAPRSDGFGAGGEPDPGTVPTGAQQRTFYLENYVEPALGIPSDSQNLQTLAIFNTFTYGGIGGVHATTSGGSPQGPLISLHELGHSLGELQDEYPYSLRPFPGGPWCDPEETDPNDRDFCEEPRSIHHTRLTEAQMIAQKTKWWRWLCEESLAGGVITARDSSCGKPHESGEYSSSEIWRPSEHSIMRWIGFHWDQVGREQMVGRITGRRFAGQMALNHTPEGIVPHDSVLWVETTQPKFHELDVTWRVGGPDGEVLDTDNRRNLDLGELDLAPGTVVHVEARDPVGPDGIDWVRNPSTSNSTTNSGYNGPRFVQTRQWTVGSDTVTPTPVADVDLVTGSTPTDRPVAGDEVVYVNTGHPSDRALEVSWEVNGQPVPPSTDNSVDLGGFGLAEGTHELTATVTDPAPGGDSETVTWTVDNVLPTAPRTLSEPLATLDGDVEHNVYFNGWDMRLEPQDDRTGYDEDLFVVGELRLDHDGWFNYFGFPEQEDAPFQFRHSGTDIKALTYGNLGTGGLSRAAFEQTLPDDHPLGGFIPGFGTHVVEHRAIDPAGNYGDAETYRATVLPGGSPECTRTVTGVRRSLTVTSGVTCLEDALITGSVTVRAGASLVARDSAIAGGLITTGAQAVQLFGSMLNGASRIAGTSRDVTVAGSTFNGDVMLTDNTQVSANERFSRLAGAYGPILAGATVNGDLVCTGNSADVKDFGAGNNLRGDHTGDCAGL